jgi:hypothetical protein
MDVLKVEATSCRLVAGRHCVTGLSSRLSKRPVPTFLTTPCNRPGCVLT